MGNSLGEIKNETIEHPRLGKVQTSKWNSQPSIIIKIHLENSLIYDEWLENFERIIKEEVLSEILFLPKKQDFKSSFYCGGGGEAILTYDCYMQCLKDEVVSRRTIRRPFNEKELLYLLYNILKAKHFIEKYGFTLTHVMPENMLVNEDGFLKVITHCSFPITLENFRYKNRFKAPEEFTSKKDNFSIEFERCSQTFIIGLTLLEIGTLEDCSNICSNNFFDEKQLQKLFKLFEKRYSITLCTFLAEMLQKNSDQRINSDSIYEAYKPYEYMIMNMETVPILIFPKQMMKKSIEESLINKNIYEKSLENFQNNSSVFENSFKKSNFPKETSNFELSLSALLPFEVKTSNCSYSPQTKNYNSVYQSSYITNGNQYFEEPLEKISLKIKNNLSECKEIKKEKKNNDSMKLQLFSQIKEKEDLKAINNKKKIDLLKNESYVIDKSFFY